MWQYLCFCLPLLVFISDTARSERIVGDRQQFRYRKDVVGPQEQRIDKMPLCVHDEIAKRDPHIVDLASQNVNTGEDKRQTSPTCANIRIHPELFSIDRKVSPYVQGRNSILSQAIKTLESVLLLVHPVQGNFRVPPNCTEYTSGVNRGKCRSPLPSQSNYVCNDFRTIPLSYIGVREVCSSSSQSSCTLQGPNGTGIPNTDYLLFVSASSRTPYCRAGSLAHASYCVLDSSDNNRPVVGHINICPSLIDSNYDIYSTILHEIIHALGYSIRLFKYYVGVSSNPGRVRFGPYGRYGIFKGPKAVEVAKSYYSCENIEGVALENEGTSNVATSHWEKRTLNNELMNAYISSDYIIFSEFTLALLEDSGWYKGNYTALSALNKRSLEWGKGLGCSFLTQRCVDKSVYPYLCDPSSDKEVCTFDHLSKGTCFTRRPGFDGCPVAVADEPEDFCCTDMNVTLKRNVESYGSNSICVDTIQSFPASCNTTGSTLPLCVEQESFTINGTNQYVVYLGDDRYRCEDDCNLATADNWVISCPPTEDIVSQSPVIKTKLPSLSPATKIDGPQNRTCSSEFYPFGLNHNDSTIPHLSQRDYSSPPVILAETCDLANRTVYINENGVISFGSPFNVHTPSSLPLNGTDEIIAPYWADVDTRRTGNIYYRQTTDPSLLFKANREIRAAFPMCGDVTIQNLLIATWHRVGYHFTKSDKINTFQCVLATSRVQSFAIFLYADGEIQWTTGDRSGGDRGFYGTEALAGINAGDGINSDTIPGSLTSSIINIAQTSNVGIPGIWMFKTCDAMDCDYLDTVCTRKCKRRYRKVRKSCKEILNETSDCLQPCTKAVKKFLKDGVGNAIWHCRNPTTLLKKLRIAYNKKC
ncbi:uncharacterized protein [Dysidea avara]|uniref:uncharacterized protein n=1 Tax=Dysidea avara TaxID=196820 RepID=UPI003318F92F